MIYERFDVVKVPFPFTDTDSVKKRPALVISSKEYQRNYNHCVMAMITSAKQSRWMDDVEVTSKLLPSASIVRMKIFSIDCRLIIGKLGALNRMDIEMVQNNIRKYLATTHA